jgi:hypothetical protein
MPLSPAQLVSGANTQLATYAKGDPIDQINSDRPLMQWFISKSVPSIFSNSTYNEKVRISNDSNYQNYTGDQQVTYNRKDTTRLAPYQHYEAHDGFTLNETELANNGIVLTEGEPSTPTEAETSQIIDILKEGWATLKQGFQQNWDLEIHQDGSQSPLAVPGLDLLVSTAPSTGVVGGIDSSAFPYWRNNVSMAIATGTAGALTNQMEIMWRACTRYGGMRPDAIFVGSAFLDAYRGDALLTQSRQVITPQKGGVGLDNSVMDLSFHGVPLIWDPTFDALDDKLGAITYPWKKRCYFLNSKALKLRPFKGRWMITRKPSRVYDRYTHYFGQTCDYGITMNKRNCMAVMSIA